MDMQLAPQLRRLACVMVALTIVGAPMFGAFPVSVPLSVLVTAAGLLVASRASADFFGATSKGAA